VKKYLKVVTSTRHDEYTEYEELSDEDLKDGEESDHLASLASDLFYNNCNYGYSVVDEDEVPEDQR